MAVRNFRAFILLFFAWANIVHAGPWTVGAQATNYSSTHTLGDGSNSRGGEAPYYANNEPADTPTNSTILTNWFPANCSATDTGQTCGEFQPPVATFTGSIAATTLSVPGPVTGTIRIGCNLTGTGVAGSTRITAGSGTTWTVNNSQTVASTSMSCGGAEAKARFDCNISFHEKNDPILAPGVANGSTHDHSFFGSFGFQGQAQNITYSGLRSAGGGGSGPAGYSTCYGGPLNRTLYWEPSMMVQVNGVTAVLQPFTIVTYYICGDNINGTGGVTATFGPPNCSRWPRQLDMVFGFNMADPTDTAGTNRVSAANASCSGCYAYIPPGQSWGCASFATPSYTAYSPNQVQGARQPYFNDGNGHETLNCNVTQMDGVTTCTLGTANCGYVITADVTSADCWDGKNSTSPDGRGHIIKRIRDQGISGDNGKCPNGWYLIPHFEAKPQFLFASLAELRAAYLSSDRMPGMTQFNGGQSLHADLLPAWDYGTGDAPGAMLRFFQNCLGLSMHVKNTDGVTYTDLSGNPNECGFGRADATHNLATTGAPPDGLGPNPVVNLTPDQTGALRYFPLAAGTPLPGSVIHQKH